MFGITVQEKAGKKILKNNKGGKMSNKQNDTLMEDRLEAIKEQVLQIAKIQSQSYKDGYAKGFEAGKKQALESVTKIYEEELPAEYVNESFADNI